MNDAQRLGAALMEANTVPIPRATFSCTVAGTNLQEMGTAAWKMCRAYFGEQRFEIDNLDADAVQTVVGDAVGYTARVHAHAV